MAEATNFSPAQLARAARVGLGYVYRRLEDGGLPAVKLEKGRWQISPETAEAFIEKREQRLCRRLERAAVKQRRSQCDSAATGEGMAADGQTAS